MKVSLWADYNGTTAPDENDLTFQATAYYDNAAQVTQLRIAGSCPTAGAVANFDGIRISSAFFAKSNYKLEQSDVTAPTAPTGLVSSAIAITSCTLSWTASTDAVGVTGYDVFKDGVLYGASATTTINITGLAASTTYNFTVKAKDAAGNLSVSSAGLNVTTLAQTDVTAPTVPSNLTASAIATTSCTLSWTASTDAVGVTGYDVFKDGVSYGSSATTSINVTGLTPATTYNFTVKAKDAAGNISVASAGLNVTTLAIVVHVVKVYENFEYTAGENLSTQNGGLGFS
ncbi:MAG: fibronectin type III domain-containing protein, partial [Ferruginibacter sp.]|nr:fibronectin type III domain-containing protein [Ferruginibacter sp.]